MKIRHVHKKFGVLGKRQRVRAVSIYHAGGPVGWPVGERFLGVKTAQGFKAVTKPIFEYQ